MRFVISLKLKINVIPYQAKRTISLKRGNSYLIMNPMKQFSCFCKSNNETMFTDIRDAIIAPTFVAVTR